MLFANIFHDADAAKEADLIREILHGIAAAKIVVVRALLRQ